MFGWLSRARARASRTKRWEKPGWAARFGGRTLRAANRSSRGWRTLKTTPIPPRPRICSTSRSGNAAAISSSVGTSEGAGSIWVGDATSAMRHLGQSPAGAPSGMGAWHLGQRLEETAEVFMTPVPEELMTWGDRKSDLTRARTEHGAASEEPHLPRHVADCGIAPLICDGPPHAISRQDAASCCE